MKCSMIFFLGGGYFIDLKTELSETPMTNVIVQYNMCFSVQVWKEYVDGFT